MIYECKVYKPNGKLKKVHSPKFLKKRLWENFNVVPLKNVNFLNFPIRTKSNKSKPSIVKTCRPKPCKWCKKVFTPTHSKVKTCGEICKKEFINDYFKKRRELIKKGLVIVKRRGPNARRNVPRI